MSTSYTSMHNHDRTGIFAGIGAYLIWGFLTIYWKTLEAVPLTELLAWRVAGCGVVAWLFVFLRRRMMKNKLITPRTLALLFTAALLIMGNWGLYTWAVSVEKILEASLGYYINPLVNVLLGVVFFSEKLTRMHYIAIFLAFGGVALITLEAGIFPWVSVSLAFLFGFYGVVVKHMPRKMDNIEILAWETALFGPFAVAYLVYLAAMGDLHLWGYGFTTTSMLFMAGGVTFAPLWLFGVGARRIPLSAMGFLQFLTPTLMLILGIFVYGEPFGLLRGIAFALVAAALALYAWTLL